MAGGSDEQEVKKSFASGSMKPLTLDESRKLKNEPDAKDRIMRSRMVRTFRKNQDTQELEAKSRWVVCGQDDPDVEDLDVDAPTLSHSGLMLTLQIVAPLKNDFYLTDVENAFGSGDKFERKKGKLYVTQPKGGLPGLHPEQLIQLEKCHYGMSDGPREWYMSFSKYLISCGMRQSRYDPCIFVMDSIDEKEPKGITGILAIHVDDCIWSGSGTRWNDFIMKIRDKYKWKTWRTNGGTFCGREIQKEKDDIVVTMKEKANNLTLVKLTHSRKQKPDEFLSEKEITEFRGITGSLGYMSTQARPDIAGQVSLVKQKPKNSKDEGKKVSDMIEANRIAKYVKETADFEIRVKAIELDRMMFTTYTDSGMGKSADHGSQGAYLIFATDKDVEEGKRVPAS